MESNYILKSNKNIYPQKICIHMSIEVLFIVISNCKHTKYPQLENGEAIFFYHHIMKCYSLMNDKTTWVNIRNFVLSERSHVNGMSPFT